MDKIVVGIADGKVVSGNQVLVSYALGSCIGICRYAVSYTHLEGKRLEAMSFRLLDIMVTRHGGAEFGAVSVESLFLYLYDMYVLNKSMKIYFNYDAGTVWAEGNLIKSVLMNLLDNACKASEPEGRCV